MIDTGIDIGASVFWFFVCFICVIVIYNISEIIKIKNIDTLNE